MNPRGGSRIVRRNRIRPNQALSVVAMLSVSFAAYALAQTRPMQPWRQSAESSIDIQERKDGLYVSTKNQHFSFVEKNSATGDPEWFALRETFTRTVNTDDNPVNHEVTVQAWAWSPSELKAQERWILHEEGDQGESGEIGSPFYKVTKYGCCGERTVYSYFAIDSGKRIYQSSSDLAEALVLNAYPLKERFVSYNDSTGNGKAFLTYGSRDHIISKIEIAGIGSIYETDTKLHFQYKGKQVDSPVELDDANAKAGETSPFNFVIVLQYSSGSEIHLAVHNDNVDLASSSVPGHFTISNLKVE